MRPYSSQNQKKSTSSRADATNNKRNIIVNARKLFTEEGPDVSLSAIAKAAKVSRATFYRNFSTKQELINAIFHFNLDLLQQYAEKVKDNDNNFYLLLEVIAQQQVAFHPLIGLVNREDVALFQKLISIFEPAVTEAKSKGLLRSDFALQKDLPMLITMIGGSFTHTHNKQSQKAVSKRALQLLVEGIRK